MAKVTEPNKLPPASAPWARQVTDGLNDLANRVTNFFSDQGNANRAQAANTQQLSSQFRSIPLVVNHGVRASSMSLTGSYKNIASDTIAVPTGRQVCNLFTIANAQFLDTTSGGAAMCYGRVIVRMLDDAGTSLGEFDSLEYIAAKAYGASVTPNTFAVAFGDTIPLVANTASIFILFQAYCTNPSAVSANAQNFAQLSTNASFTFSA